MWANLRVRNTQRLRSLSKHTRHLESCNMHNNQVWSTLQLHTYAYYIQGRIQKFPDWVDNEIYAYNNKYSLRSNIKGYDGKTR
jgi:hypothetical protein